MSGALAVLVLIVVALNQAYCEEDFQQWSVQTYLEVDVSFYCNNSLYPIFINADDKLTWRRRGHEIDIQNDDHFKLSAVSGVDNMRLTIKNVTDEMQGIYFCDIYSAADVYVGRVMKSLNNGGHKYHDYIDKYRTNIYTGLISAGCVFFLVVAIATIDNFRYQSEEERLEKHQAKEERLRRKAELHNGAHNNPAFNTAGDDSYDKIGSDATYEARYNNFEMTNTHL